MIPLVNSNSGSSYRARTGIKDKIREWTKSILSNKDSRNLFLFLILNLSFAFVELLYGIWTNSLGLISDSFHMFFDCTGLLAGLVASIISKWKPDDKFSYGYVRAEILAGFVNGLFLLFIAFFICSEAVERFIEPPEVKHERLFVVSVLGLLVNLIGIYVFQHGHPDGHCSHGGHSHSHSGHSHSHSGHSHSHSGHSHSHSSHSLHDDSTLGSNGYNQDSFSLLMNNANHRDKENSHTGGSHLMKGVFLHILADTLGSVGVIISAVLMYAFGWMRADPICSMFISLLIAVSVISLITDSLLILMQRQPKELDDKLPICYNKITKLKGVECLQDPHFWTLSSGVFVGALKLEVSDNADHKFIVSETHLIFNRIGVTHLYVQLDYKPDRQPRPRRDY